MWSCESVVKNELSHKEALNLARGINPFISQQAVNKIVTVILCIYLFIASYQEYETLKSVGIRLHNKFTL
jgi:hypothetical protein